MTCPDCSAWKARVEELERRLGISRQLGSIGAIVERFDVSATQARILLRLFAAGRAYVSIDGIMDVMSSESRGSAKSTVSQIRAKVGEGFIESPRGQGVSDGYRLSTGGAAQVLAALERPEFQEARG